MSLIFADRVKETTTTTGTGTITLAGAVSGFQSFAAIGNGNICYYVIAHQSAAEWEIVIGTYTSSGTTLSRTSVLASSNSGSAVSFSAGTKDVFGAFPSAIAMPAYEVCCGRLTLASGYPVYSPSNAIAASGQDTGADTVTLTAHGWVNGTMVVSSATSGGLTAGTQYYINATSANAVSFHTTVAGALAATSKVDITGAVTATITPSGISNTTIYFTPYKGNRIGLYNGTGWIIKTFSELSLALGTLTSALPYDVFVYDNAGTITLELLAWTSDSARATALVLQDGVYCKTGALTRRYLGTIRTDSTTTTIDDAGGVKSAVGGKRFVWNYYNRTAKHLRVKDTTDSWAYNNNSTWRAANGAAGNIVEFVQGVIEDAFDATLYSAITAGTSGSGTTQNGIGLDSTTSPGTFVAATYGTGGGLVESQSVRRIDMPSAAGYHYISWLERSTMSGGCTFYGDGGGEFQSGLTASIQC